MVLEGAFTNARALAGKLYPFIPPFFISYDFNSAKKIKEVKAPKLFFHAADDEMISFTLGKKLYQLSPPPKTFIKLEGGHNEAYSYTKDRYVSSLKEFIGGLDKADKK